MAQPTTDPIAVEFAGLPDETRAPGGERGGSLEFVNALLKRWRLVVGLPVLAAILAAVVVLLLPPRYTATVTFVPEQRAPSRGSGAAGGGAGLVGLAGQLGIPLGMDPTQSPRFYAEVLTSRELLSRVLLTRFADPGRPAAGDSVPLLAILRVRGGIWGAKSAADSLDRGVRKLGRRVSARVDMQTYLVYLSVTTRYPDLSAAVATRFIEYLNEFNATKRESQARARRQFVEQRILDGERELHAAEDDLRRFHERNRAWQESPELSAEEGRLHMQVNILQEVYLTLRRDYEQARIEEVNDTPVLTVIDPAVAPVRQSRWREGVVLLAFVLGGVIAVLGAWTGGRLDRLRRDEQDGYREFTGLLQRLRREVARPFGRSPRRPSRP